MILQIFSVYDRAAMTYGHPFCMVAIPAASRAFIDQFDAPNTLLAKHPDDFELRHIGSFDDESGEIQTFPVSHTIITGTAVMAMRPKDVELPLEDTKVGGTE